MFTVKNKTWLAAKLPCGAGKCRQERRARRDPGQLCSALGGLCLIRPHKNFTRFTTERILWWQNHLNVTIFKLVYIYVK